MTPSQNHNEEDKKDGVIYRAENITKIFPGTVALKGVNFNVYEGRINCLVGENGAGKSTLMNILAGVDFPTDGKLILEGEEITLNSPLDADKKGIAIIFQELDLFPNLNVAENIFITHEKTKNGLYINRKIQEEAAREVLDRLKTSINPKTKVEHLRIGQQQFVAIAKALSREARILIMDEPTSSLSAGEVEVLFQVIKRLKTSGVSIVYISHRIEEIVEIGDYVTVLRDGALISEEKVEKIDLPWIVDQMVGRKIDRRYIYKEHKVGKELLRVESLALPKHGGGYLVDHVSFSLREGEILGLYGLRGAGRTETLECIMGIHPDAEGVLYLEGREVASHDITGRLGDGIAIIPEDRQKEGLIPILSVMHNMTISSLRYFSRNYVLNKKKEVTEVKEKIRELDIKVPSPRTIVASLSGGNQQKVVITKGLLTRPKILLMDEPTRGIDVGAKGEIFTIVRDLAEQGLGILLVDSELKEIMAISDRVIVLSNGQITGKFNRSEMDEHKLVMASAVAHRVKNAIN